MTAPDRRRRPRVPLCMKVYVEFEGRWHDFLEATDLSMGGIGILSPGPIDPGRRATILILLEESEERIRLALQAKVARCSLVEEGVRLYEIGFEFDRPDSDTSIQLFRLIRYHEE